MNNTFLNWIFIAILPLAFAACSEFGLATRAQSNGLFHVTGCMNSPSAPIREYDIEYHFKPYEEELYRVHRATNDDIIVEQTDDTCYFSISATSGEPLEFAVKGETDGWFRSESYQHNVNPANEDFIDRCRSTEQYRAEIDAINKHIIELLSNIPPSSPPLDTLPPCDVLLGELKINLIFRSKTEAFVGGVTILENQPLLWSR